MDMKKWVAEQIAADRKKPLPVLSFPAIQLMDITVADLIGSTEKQAEAMRLVAERVDAAASVSFMDLSVEAEAFGSEIRVSDDEVPTVIGSIIDDETEPDDIFVPEVGAGRTGHYIEAIRAVAPLINDRPVFAGVIGPFSLAGRLMDVNEVMVLCYEEPELVHAVLDKVTGFIADYAEAFKDAGADGVMMAEPLAGLLPPALLGEFSTPYVKRIVDAVQTDEFAVVYHNAGADGVMMAEPLAGLLPPALLGEFSTPYVKRIVDAVQTDEFAVVYHNCGSSVVKAADEVFATGSAAYHFGNPIDMADIMPLVPEGVIAMGNIDPAGEIRNGTPESVRAATLDLMAKCAQYPNFVPSTGCDVPPMSPWDNVEAFFAAVDEYYEAR